MIDLKKLYDLKEIIKLECKYIYDDHKDNIDVAKKKIEQKVGQHIEEKFKNFSDRRKLYEEIRDEMFELFFTKQGEVFGLTNEEGHVKWFDRKLIENGPYWEVYRQYLIKEGKMPLETINDLDKSTDLILADIEAPDRSGNWDRRGMVVGSVQSGKTSNYLGLVAKARDAGYKFIVVLSGANNDLRQQTQQRVDEGYIGLHTYILENARAKDANELGLLRRRLFEGKFQYPTSGTVNKIDGDFNTSRATGMVKHIIQKEDFNSYIFVIKKNKTPLTKLIEWITALPQSVDPKGAAGFEKIPEKNTKKPPFINDFPLLLIDDECDHYSIDTGKPPRDENGDFLLEYDPKTINGLIRKLLQCFSRRIYIGYTATPFANILIHDEKVHENYGEDIFPKSFIYDIIPPPNHKGLESIFGKKENEDNGIESENLSNFLIPIKDFCRNPEDLFCKEGWFPPKHGTTHVPIYDQKKDPIDDNIDEETLNFYFKLIDITKEKFNKEIHLPPSLIHAVMSFILACSVRNIRSIQQFYAHKSMLIHVTKNIEPQKILYDELSLLFAAILECIKDNTKDKEIFHSSLKSIYETYFMRDTVEFKDSNKETITYDKILHNENGLKFCIGEISRNIFRMSGKQSKPDYDEYKRKNGFGLMTIIIGGDKLSRGVTFDGLSTSYFLRSSRMFDTLMQMGRWFGYRSGYEDLCRLYTSADLLDSFVEISIGSQRVREEIRIMNKLGRTPKDFGLWIQTSPYTHLIPTAKNKMRHAEITKVNYSAWGNQMPTLPWKKEVVLKNFDLTSNFIKDLKDPNEINIKRNFGKNRVKEKNNFIEKNILISADPSYFWKNINYEFIIDYLLKFNAHENSKFQPSEMAAYIKNAAKKKGMLTNWSVALIGNGSSGVKENIGGREVNLAFRKPKNTCTNEKASYGVIWDPNHEALDLTEKDYQKANKLAFPENENNDLTTDNVFTKILREQRSNKNGLLLIYPILPINYDLVPKKSLDKDPQKNFDQSWNDFKKEFDAKNNEKLTNEIKSRKALISLAVSFPKTSDDLAIKAITNSVYQKLEDEDEL